MDNPSFETFSERLYTEHHALIHGLAQSRLKDKNLVDAVVRLTFHMALDQLSVLEKDPKPRRWLVRTALNIIGICNDCLSKGGTFNA